MAFNKTQTGVAIGMGLAVGIAAIAFVLAYLAQWPNLANHADLEARLKLATLAAMAPTISLFFCVARLAKHRFATPQDIQGSALTEGAERARLLQAMLQNTLEQAMLAVPLYLAASLFLPPRLLSLVACGAILFTVGRLLFFLGYEKGARSRAAGFGLTFYPSVALLFLVITHALLSRDA